ncbi:MAG: hypothetical protein IJQ55_00880 [Alphaproteobacteria bacterium]|nr:hypothetical protein [Alphaproteobacteria bacterium]
MRERVCKLSLFSMILACVSASPDVVYAGPNSARSRADAYNQVSMLSYQQEYMDAMAANNPAATTASATENLPVAVADKKLADAILHNTSTTTMADLDACAMLIPTGIFRWDIPEAGFRQEQKPQCVAVVELQARNGNSMEVLATTTVAAGDSIKCNIDSFPESGMNAAALSRVELPADKAPTEDDVKQVMNQEQKQNAGLKIAAGALIAGVAGNMLAPKTAGDNKLFGTGKTRLLDTAIGATAGAGIMAASTYSGKVAGDTIKSTAVNAASGMIVGNMLAGTNGGDSIIATTTCEAGTGAAKIESDCVIGKIHKVDDDGVEKYLAEKKKEFFIIDEHRNVKMCEKSNGKYKCELAPGIALLDVMLEDKNGSQSISFDTVFKADSNKSSERDKLIRYKPDEGSNDLFVETSSGADVEFFKVKSAKKSEGSATLAYAVFTRGSLKKFGGYKVSEWYEIEKQAKYYYRNADGTVGSEIEIDTDKLRFTPNSRDASDGELVDLSNQARLKGTLAGTAAGGALGGFSGYEGAKTEVSERWVAAVREYKDSLSNFVCVTGQRFLSQYNDDAIIPALQQSNK